MLTRRQAFKNFALAAGSFAATAKAGFEFARACTKTPAQTEGPFYPVVDQFDKDTDLTTVRGSSVIAEGDIIYVGGTVTDSDCNPIKGARVQIWQACHSGRYDHPEDNSGLELDRNFQYWGIAHTNQEGKYQFKTVLPGSYPAGDGWIRPPHIHFKISKIGFHELTTQLYFGGNPLNDSDLILKQLPAADRKHVVIPLQPAAEENAQRVEFPITLMRVR